MFNDKTITKVSELWNSTNWKNSEQFNQHDKDQAYIVLIWENSMLISTLIDKVRGTDAIENVYVDLKKLGFSKAVIKEIKEQVAKPTANSTINFTRSVDDPDDYYNPYKEEFDEIVYEISKDGFRIVYKDLIK